MTVVRITIKTSAGAELLLTVEEARDLYAQLSDVMLGLGPRPLVPYRWPTLPWPTLPLEVTCRAE